MADSHVDWRKNQNIKPMKLSKKEEYYFDLLNIEDSWTGRMDTNICNMFIMEAEQQLVNAIELFEIGYFDCSYYSLRSAVEISTTMVFLSDMPDAERKKYLSAWKATDDFPMQGQMIKQLSRQGNVFADMVSKMSDFFASAKALSAELNKYVHKQSLQHFYISRNYSLNRQKTLDGFIKSFENYLQRCIGVVAVMRLAIDPFPILLMDEEILHRCLDSMTEPYSEEFVEKYIGETVISQYKDTDIYIETYNFFITAEKKKESVFDVMKHQYINSKKMDEIFSQLHLLSKEDIICVLMVAASEKVVKVYCHGGVIMYFTDRNTNRSVRSWSSTDFKIFAEAEERINQPYDEVYISTFTFEEDEFYVEHNKKLIVDEVGTIIGFVYGALAKISTECDE